MKLAIKKSQRGRTIKYIICQITECKCGVTNNHWLNEAGTLEAAEILFAEEIEFQKSCKDKIIKEVVC